MRGMLAGAFVSSMVALANWHGQIGPMLRTIIVGSAIGFAIGYFVGKRRAR
jgi:hypothetical protein